MQYHKIFQAIAIPYSALISVIMGLMIFSFPIGAYLFFNSDLGGSINYQYPLYEMEFIKGLGWEWASDIQVGDVFVVSWMFFLVVFAISVFGPNRSFVRVLSPIMAGSAEQQDGNYIIQVIKWFSVIIVLSVAIDVIQRQFGVSTMPPPFGNDMLQLLSVTLAPIVEEVGFRVILVGIPVFLLYSQRMSARGFVRSLWNPSEALDITRTNKALVIIMISAVLFGIAHIASDQGWTSGKMAQATMSGAIIGWAYVRYGFVAAVLIHWAANYVVFSYGYLVASINNVSIMEAFSHSLLHTIEILLVATGVLSLAMIWFGRKKHYMSNANLSPL